MRILLSLLTLFMAFSLFAADEKAKDTAVALKGEHTPGAGYKIYFSEDKNTFLNLTGYARFQTSWNIDDKANKDSGKFSIPYFRFYVDGQSNKNWSWHTRFDYRQDVFMSKRSNTVKVTSGAVTTDSTNPDGRTYGAPGLYFARAYLTYKANDNLKVDFGRISNQIYAYDVMNNANIKVGYGVMPKFTYGDFSLVGTVNYNNDGQRMGPTDDASADGVRVNQLTTLGTRAGYKYKISKDFAFEFGMMVNGETQNSYEKTVQYMPDFRLTGPYEFYLLNQSLKKVSSRHTPNFIENYTEVGFGIDGFWYPDINYGVEKESPSADTKHTIAGELYIKHTAEISTLWTVIYGNYLSDVSTDRSKSFKAWIQYDF